MVNYQLGKIYRIVCNTTGLTYYGSTCEKNLSSRLSHHKNDYNHYLNGIKNFITSFEILKNNNYEIILVESYPCNSKDELHARERFYVENNECVNKCIPNRTRKEYYEANKEHLQEYNKEYREQNKEQLQEYYKQWRKENKEEIGEKNKQYYIQNKEEIKEISKQYYNQNRQTILEKTKQKYMCVCGSVIRFGLKARHFKSQKHQLYLRKNNV